MAGRNSRELVTLPAGSFLITYMKTIEKPSRTSEMTMSYRSFWREVSGNKTVGAEVAISSAWNYIKFSAGSVSIGGDRENADISFDVWTDYSNEAKVLRKCFKKQRLRR